MGFRHTANRRRHYERMPRWPERFVVVGDAACTLDPVYGQGMTVAAFHAVALDEWLHGRADGEAGAQAFQRRVARVAEGAWMIATGADQYFPTTVGPPVQRHTRFINWYMSRLTAAATVDETLCARIFDVFAFRGEPSTLFRPATLAKLIIVSTRDPRMLNSNDRPATTTPSR
jgi:2-polyprenyl-6-methoxyphenol hydroxylase-like FAD-dependent oxidoreductase